MRFIVIDWANDGLVRFVVTLHVLSEFVRSAVLRFVSARDVQLAARSPEFVVEVAPRLELLRGPLDDIVAAPHGIGLRFIFDWLQCHEFGQARREVQSLVMLLVHLERGCYLLEVVHVQERFGFVIVVRTLHDMRLSAHIQKEGNPRDIVAVRVILLIGGVYKHVFTCVLRCN